jgi:phosphoglycolate phosphatase-like HAD superfamily hydrolase
MDLFRSHGLEASEENWQRFRAGYLSRLKKALTACKGFVLPGVPSFLQALADRGDVAIGLLTGNMRDGAECKLTHYELWHWFAFGGYGDEHMERCDIAAAALADAKRHLNGHANYAHSSRALDNRRMVVIGDTPHDIRCGRSIGAQCVAVPTGNFSADELRGSTPDVLVDTLEDHYAVLALFDR